MAKARTIREERTVSKALDRARDRYPRVDEVWEAWKWRLARGPLIDSVPIAGTMPQAYIAKSPDFAHYEGLPAGVVIVFTLPDDEHVDIIAVGIY